MLLHYTYIYAKQRLPLPSPHLQVGVGRLTPSYMRLMLPKLLWFQGLAEAVQVFAMVWEYAEGNAKEVRTSLSHPGPPPDAWMAAGRHGALPTGLALKKRQEVMWEVPRAVLAQMIEEAAESGKAYESCSLWFWGGCFWKAYLRLEQPGLKLKCCVSTYSETCLPRPPALGASFCAATTSARHLPYYSGRGYYGSWIPDSSGGLIWFRPGMIHSHALPIPAPLKSMPQLAQHLKDGRLVVKAKIQDVR